jgi:hypothetical protein
MNLQGLTEHLYNELKPYDFKRADEALSSLNLSSQTAVRAIWKRKTWNTNRGVALLETGPDIDSLEAFVGRVREPIGKAIGYVPFFYPLGLQLILAGRGILSEQSALSRLLSKIDNQTVVLQSIHVIDLNDMAYVSERTWGQVVTGRYQDAIEKGIKSFLY